MDADKRAVLEEKLAVLKRSFVDHLQARSAEIILQWQDCIANQFSVETLFNLYRNVHSLAGSGATFGYNELGQRARELEIILRARKDSGVAPPQEELVQIEKLMALMLEEIDALTQQ